MVVKKIMHVLTTAGILLVLLLTEGNFLFGQKRFMLNEGEAEKFKMATRLFQKGEQLFTKGKFKKAEESFLECLEKFPGHANADYYLARLHYQENDFSGALRHIENAKKNYEIIASLGVSSQMEYLEKLRLQKQQLEDEINTLKQVASSGTNRSRGGQDTSSEISKRETTLQILKDRLNAPIPDEKQIPAAYYYVHGNILFKIKKYKEALDEYLEAVRVEPTHGNANVNLANLYFMGRQYEKALFYLKKAEDCGVTVDPRFKQALYKAMRK
jgi:tetratricopeptide (TPR) repeat protein